MTVVQGQDEVLPEEELSAAAEKLGAAGVLAAHVAWYRQAARIDCGLALGGNVQKVMLTEKWVVSFPDVLTVWVETPSLLEPRIIREADAPAVG